MRQQSGSPRSRKALSSLRLFLVIGTIASFVGPLSAALADTKLPTIALDQAIHFTDPEGQKLIVGPGAYLVEMQEAHLRLTPTEGSNALVLAAVPAQQEDSVEASVAMVVIEEGRDDHVHILLLLPGRGGLDAIGTLSGISTRGTGFSQLSRTQVQNAYAQQRRSSESSSRLQPIKVAPQAAGKKRPLNVQSGPARIVTWEYFHRKRPEVVARALADVQAGKRPMDSVNGLASPEQLTALLKTNWSAEVARLTAARTAAIQQGGVTSRAVPGMAINQSTAPKISPPAPPIQPERLAPMARPVMLQTRDLGDTYSGERRIAEYGMYASFDGVLQCRLDQKATANRFRVEAISPISGEWKGGKPVNAAIVSGTSYTEAQRAQKTTTSYAEVGIRAYDRVGCRVFFEPDPGAGPPAGRYEATLEVDLIASSPAGRQSYVLPIRVNNLGINFDILVNAEVGHVDTLTDSVVEMPIVITYAGPGSRSGPIRAEQLPPGVVMEPAPDFFFQGPGTQRQVLRFRVTKAARDGPAQPIIVSVAVQRRLVALSLTIYHPIVFWSYGNHGFSNEFPGLNQPKGNDIQLYNLDITLRDDGTWWWEAVVGNGNIIDLGGTTITLDIRFLDSPGVGDLYYKNLGPGHETWRHDLGHTWLRDNYLIAAERGVSLDFCCYDY
jgi:hypothetical protein